MIDEFEALPSTRAIDYLKRKGVDEQRIYDCGGIRHASIKPYDNLFEFDSDGYDAIIMPVYHGHPYSSELVNLAAWIPGKEKQWYLKSPAFTMLGHHHMMLAHIYHKPITVAANPFEWLKSGDGACCPLTPSALESFIGIKEIITDTETGKAIFAALQRAFPFPKVTVQK